MSKGNVIALPTLANDDQPWQCQVCKATMSYKQPIALRKQLDLLGAFMSEHEHPESTEFKYLDMGEPLPKVTPCKKKCVDCVKKCK